MKTIWETSIFTDLRFAIAADLSERRIKPWEYLPVYPDLRKMNLVRQALVTQIGGVELCQLSPEQLIDKIDEGIAAFTYGFEKGDSNARDQILKFMFRPFTRGDPYGYIIEHDSLGKYDNGKLVGDKCPYPLDPLQLERFITGLDAEELVPSMSKNLTCYELPSKDPKYNP